MEKKFYWVLAIAIVFLCVGMAGYLLAPAKKPELPSRIFLPASAGDVVFDHKSHYSAYNLTCLECHHHPTTTTPSFVPCASCHTAETEGKPYLPRCAECHDVATIRDTPMLNTKDAFHKQCIECHETRKVPATACADCHGNA